MDSGGLEWSAGLGVGVDRGEGSDGDGGGEVDGCGSRYWRTPTPLSVVTHTATVAALTCGCIRMRAPMVVQVPSCHCSATHDGWVRHMAQHTASLATEKKTADTSALWAPGAVARLPVACANPGHAGSGGAGFGEGVSGGGGDEAGGSASGGGSSGGGGCGLGDVDGAADGRAGEGGGELGRGDGGGRRCGGRGGGGSTAGGEGWEGGFAVHVAAALVPVGA